MHCSALTDQKIAEISAIFFILSHFCSIKLVIYHLMLIYRRFFVDFQHFFSSSIFLHNLLCWHLPIYDISVIYRWYIGNISLIYPDIFLLGCIKSCIEDLSCRFLENRWLVHNLFMGLSNPLEVIVQHLLIRVMDGLGYRDGFPMVSALVRMVTH